MMGGHLDSWTSATGATDNAIGCAIMMEAARILETVGAKPRRTIRVALWSGEEEGLLGSFAYVKNHFGSAEEPGKEFGKIDAYWNIDNGTGRVRGASIFGPPQAAAILAQYLKPFEDWGVYGAMASTARIEGGSDNGAFAVAGLPGIGTQQDPIEYNSTTWHTNLDTYERIMPEDVMHNAVITASVMLGLANRDEMLPRFAPSRCRPFLQDVAVGVVRRPNGPVALLTFSSPPRANHSPCADRAWSKRPGAAAQQVQQVRRQLLRRWRTKPSHGKVTVKTERGVSSTRPRPGSPAPIHSRTP